LLVGLLFQLRDKVVAKQPLCLAARMANMHQFQPALNHTARRPDVPACLPTFTRWTNNSNDCVNQSIVSLSPLHCSLAISRFGQRLLSGSVKPGLTSLPLNTYTIVYTVIYRQQISCQLLTSVKANVTKSTIHVLL